MSDALTRLGLPIPGRRGLLVGIVALSVALSVAVALTLQIARQIDNLGASSIDNVQWTLSQMDVELLTLEIVVDDARGDPSRLEEVRTRFDIAYSRFATLQAGVLFTPLRQSRGFRSAFQSLSDFMSRSVPLIDGPDADLIAALPALKGELRQLIPVAHRLGTIGVEVFARQADATRGAIKSALITLGVVSGVLFLALSGSVFYLVRVTRLTRLRATEAAATASRLDAVIGASLDPVITLDEAGRITAFSPAGPRIFGLSAEEALGTRVTRLIPEIDGQPQLRLTPQPQRLRVTARHADGSEFPAEVSVSPVTAVEGLFVVFLADLSAQVQAETALVAARDAALAGEKAKADLLMVMSHEIRTPLNGMIGTMDLLRATDLSPQQAEYLRIMSTSGQLLMRHVTDTLDMARLDSGAPLSVEPVELMALATEILDNQRPASAAQGNRLSLSGPEAPFWVLADGGRLRQVLLNLVGNAVKFTRHGTIDLGLCPREGGVEITVSDTGKGIAAGDLDRIFEDFVTLDPSFARNAAGTGLGLGIVRRIVTRMGGTIAVDSTLGQGSRFRLTLPLPATDPPQDLVRPPALPLRSRDILVIEDNEFNRLIVREFLARDGHRIAEARDGDEGLALAAQRRFDLIFVDISMPGRDGISVAAALKAEGGPNADTPLLALTAHAMPEEIRRFHAAGLQDVLLKPLGPEDLRRALATHLPPDPPLCDPEAVAQMARSLPPGLMATLTARFLADLETRLARMMAPGGALRDEAHHMAGSAGAFGARALQARLQRVLDLLAAQGPDVARAELPGLAALVAETAEAYRLSSRDQASSLR